MGEMRDSDWSRENLLRSDWLGPLVATMTTEGSTNVSCQLNFRLFVSCPLNDY